MEGGSDIDGADAAFEQGSIAAANLILRFLGAIGEESVAARVLKAWDDGMIAGEPAPAALLSDPRSGETRQPLGEPDNPTLLHSEISRLSGYTGDECSTCHGVRMRRNGSCLVCEDCGTTTGCS